MSTSALTMNPPLSATELVALLRAKNFRERAVTVFGYGNMGKEYVKALQALGVGQIRVVSLSPEPLLPLANQPGVHTQAVDYHTFQGRFETNELAIVALPIADLIPSAHRLVELGCRNLLIEKPISLYSTEIEKLNAYLKRSGIQSACAYNRAAYPALLEAASRIAQEGGITSCTYTFTEFVNRLNLSLYTSADLERWGIANSLHVMSLAHRLIGLPRTWQAYRQGEIPWHPSGAVFVGSGVSDQNVPFTYHADWGSTGRWSVEIHSRQASYRLCPLEKLFVRKTATGDWEEIVLESFASDVKTGFVEQVASCLDTDIATRLPLWSLLDTVRLTAFAENLFGYSS